MANKVEQEILKAIAGNQRNFTPTTLVKYLNATGMSEERVRSELVQLLAMGIVEMTEDRKLFLE